MGLFGSILNGIINAAGLGYEIHKDQHLTGSQREANEFSAEQAAENRGFQHAEAELARDWQEQQYLKYNSPSAQVAQYQAAGINPATMYGQSFSPASVATSAPAGDSAASVTPPGGDLVGMIGKMMELSLLGEQKRKLELENKGREISNSIQDEYGRSIAKSQVDEANARIAKLAEETKNEKVRNGLLAAEKTLKELEADPSSFMNFEKTWRANYIEQTGSTPEAGLLKTVVDMTLKGMTGFWKDVFNWRNPFRNDGRPDGFDLDDGTTMYFGPNDPANRR